MSVQMLGETPAVAAAPRRVGALLTAALPGGDGADGQDWRKGVIAWPEAAPGWEVLTDCDPEKVDYGLRTGAAPIGATPFMIRTLTTCPRTDIDILVERAQRQIVAVSSQAVARELWTGELTTAAPWTTPDVPYELANPRPDSGTSNAGPFLNPHLDAGDLLTAQTHPAAAVAAVEAEAGDRIAGGPLYIHVPVEWVLELTQFNIRADGDVLRTPLGNVVVADAGYPGTAGASGPMAAYATGPVQVWLDAPTTFGDPSQVVDRGHNHIAVWSERPALVLFDPQTLVGCPVT